MDVEKLIAKARRRSAEMKAMGLDSAKWYSRNQVAYVLGIAAGGNIEDMCKRRKWGTVVVGSGHRRSRYYWRDDVDREAERRRNRNKPNAPTEGANEAPRGRYFEKLSEQTDVLNQQVANLAKMVTDLQRWAVNCEQALCAKGIFIHVKE